MLILVDIGQNQPTIMIIFDTDISLGTPGAEIDDGAALILLLQALGDQVTAVTTTLLNTLQTNAPTKNREEEAAKARARAAKRFPQNRK